MSVAAATAVGAFFLPVVMLNVQLAEPNPAIISTPGAEIATLAGSALVGALVLGGGRFIMQRIGQWRQHRLEATAEDIENVIQGFETLLADNYPDTATRY